jgi:hypothetical protein
MADVVEKLTTAEPLSVDQLIEYLAALKEIRRPPGFRRIDAGEGELRDVPQSARKVVAECIICHTYHAPIAAQTLNVQR